MKWSIVGLLVLGLLAAVSAVLFLFSFQNKNKSRTHAAGAAAPAVAVPMAPILVAAQDLAPMTVVRSEMLTSRVVEKSLLPEDAFSDPVQVVGKFLVAPLRSGQAFTKDHFARPGSGLNLAAGLPEGMRAVSVAVVESMALGSLIYPGGVVDVIAAFKSDGKDRVSITLLRSVMVLAIGRQTITDSDKPASSSSLRDRHITVSLLVTPEQAERLKLLSEEGSISLALRNPMDETVPETTGARLSMMSPVFADLAREKRAERLEADLELARRQLQQVRDQGHARGGDEIPPRGDAWQVLILRGGFDDETKTFSEHDFTVRDR